MSIFDKPITTGQNSPSSSASGGSIFNSPITTSNYNPNSPVIKTTTPAKTQTQAPSIISSAPQIISGIAKGISIGNLIVTAATRQPTQPQIDVSKVALPTPQPQATPQKTISITPNQKILTPQQLKVVTPQPVSGQSATMKAAKPGTPSIVSRAAAVVPQTTAQAKDTATSVNEFIKSPSQFKSKATYDANNSTGLIQDIATRKITDFLHLPREAPAMIKAAIDAVAGPVGQGIALAMQERLNPPKTAGELVGLKAKQITNAITIGLSPINVLFAAADKTPYVSELMRAVTIPFLAAGEVSTKASDKIIDALPISQQAKNNIKGPIGELAALTAQIALGHSLAKISGKAMGKLDDASKAAFTTITKDIIETNGGKGTISFTPADVRKVAVFNEGGKYHKALVDILAQEGKNAGDLWTKAVKEGITIELPFEKVIGMVDKPWWGKIKKFLNAGVTDTTTTTQVPGRIVGPGTEGATPAVSIEKKITALLPENINHNPQAVINAVIKGGLDTTPEGKTLIKSALEAQQAGTDLTISTADTQAAVKAINHEIRLHAEDPKGLHLDNGNTYVHLTPEQSVALSPELQKIPESQSLIHISSLSSLVDNPKYTPVTSLAELAASNPDVKTALVNAGIDPLTGRVNRAMLVAEQAKQMAQTVADEVKKYEAQAAVDKNIAAKEAQQTKVIDQVSTPPEDVLRQEALKYKSAEEFVMSANTVNPTGNVFTEYVPQSRNKIPMGDNIQTLEKSIGGSADDIIIVYRGTSGNKINAGDFITTNKQLAKDYAGTSNVLKLKVRKGDVIDTIDEAGGEEYIYRPNADKENVYTKSQLTDIWNKANEPVVKAPEVSQAVTKPVVEKPVEPLAPQDMEAAKARIEARAVASAEMDKIPTNTDVQTPVGTGELKKSKAYTRVFDLLKEEYQQDVSYNVLNLEKDAKNAVDYIAKDPKSAIRIGLGLEQPPEGQTETAISIALAEKAATEGDHALQSRLESSRSLRQTRRGQEIVSERGRFEADSPHKYMRELLNKRLANLGANVKDALAETVNRATNVKQAAMEKIDSEAKKIKEAIKKDRKKIQMAQDIINSLICK